MEQAGEGTLSPSPAAQHEPLVVPDIPSVKIKRKRGRPRVRPLSGKEKRKHAVIPTDEQKQPRRHKNDGVGPSGPIVIEYDPHIKQQLFAKAIEKGAKIVLFMAGVRSGKSWSASYECLKLIYQRKHQTNLGYIVTPTVNMGRIPRRLFIQAAGDALVSYKRASDDGPPHCRMVPPPDMPGMQFFVEFHSGEYPDRMRGASVDWAWLDEAAYMKPEVMDVVLGRVMENDGIIIITTSPSTKQHWTYTDVMAKAARCGKCKQFYHDHDYIREGTKLVPNDHEPVELYNDDGTPPDTSIAVIQCSTYDNTHLEKDFIKKLEERYALKDPIIARRELFGEVCGFEGLVYRSFDRDLHRSDFTRVNIPQDAEIIAGIDFGVNDPFVVAFLAKAGEAWHLVDEYYWQGEPRSIKQHVEEMKRRCPLLPRVRRFWYDPSGKQQGIELAQCGLRNLFKARKRFAVGQSWVRFRIDTLNALLLARDADGMPLLRLSRACPSIISDFESRKWKRYTVVGDDDRVRVMDQKGKEVDRNAGDDPAPGFDHGTDAVEYALVSEVVAGRYKINNHARAALKTDGPVVLGGTLPKVQSPLAEHLASQMAAHAAVLAKPKTTRDAWSFRPRWS